MNIGIIGTVQRWLPDAHVIRAFNIAGNVNLVDAKFDHGHQAIAASGPRVQVAAALARVNFLST